MRTEFREIPRKRPDSAIFADFAESRKTDRSSNNKAPEQDKKAQRALTFAA